MAFLLQRDQGCYFLLHTILNYTSCYFGTMLVALSAYLAIVYCVL